MPEEGSTEARAEALLSLARWHKGKDDLLSEAVQLAGILVPGTVITFEPPGDLGENDVAVV